MNKIIQKFLQKSVTKLALYLMRFERIDKSLDEIERRIDFEKTLNRLETLCIVCEGIAIATIIVWIIDLFLTNRP